MKSFEIFDVTLYVLKNQVFLNQFHQFWVFFASKHGPISTHKFWGVYVKIRSAVQKLWTKKWFCTVSFASISYSVTWKMCLLHTQNSFLRVPAKCFPQSWVGGSYLFLSFWWCTMYLSRQQAKVPFQISQIRTVWHFEVPMKKSNYIGNGYR